MELFGEGMLPLNTDLPSDMCGTKSDLHNQRDTVPVQDHMPGAERISVYLHMCMLLHVFLIVVSS